MANYSFRNDYRSGYSNRGGNYSNRSYSYNGRSSNAYQRQVKKHTGCKYRAADKNGKPVTTGWNYSRKEGLVTFLATPYKGTSIHTSKSGREWLNVMVKVSPKMKQSFIVSGLMERHSGKVIIKDLNIVMKPSAPNGGYCGRIK